MPTLPVQERGPKCHACHRSQTLVNVFSLCSKFTTCHRHYHPESLCLPHSASFHVSDRRPKSQNHQEAVVWCLNYLEGQDRPTVHGPDSLHLSSGSCSLRRPLYLGRCFGFVTALAYAMRPYLGIFPIRPHTRPLLRRLHICESLLNFQAPSAFAKSKKKASVHSFCIVRKLPVCRLSSHGVKQIGFQQLTLLQWTSAKRDTSSGTKDV